MKLVKCIQWSVLVLFVGLLLVPSGSDLAVLNAQEEKKTEQQKEDEVLDLEEAEKQAAKPTSDVGYTKEEYDAFQKALNNPDLKLRAEELMQFAKDKPESKLREHALNAVPAVMAELYQAKDMASLAPVAESYLELKPGDEAALGVATEAFYTNKDYAKATKYGEAFYEKKPSPELAQLLAHSFDQLKNDGKFANYAEKALGNMSPQDAFFYSAKLSYYYANRKDIGRAATHCQKMMSAYGDGEPPPGYTADKWNQEKARSYAIIGRNYYERKQFANAVSAFNNSLKYYRQNDEAYYYMGMSYWSANDPTNALKSFAKSYSLNKAYAKTARDKMETLYKALNNGSVEGIDRILRAAAAEMR
ncbi:MAG: hypothetical protein AB1898_16615 [Acidobacteriota bacterium]